MARLITNLIKGAYSIFSISPGDGVSYVIRRKYHPHASDTEALASDWQAIGRDLYKALNKVSHGEK